VRLFAFFGRPSSNFQLPGEKMMTEQELYPPIKLLTGNEVARMLKISRAYAYRLMQQGAIPTIRIGRSVRVSYPSLLNFIEANSQPVKQTTDQPSRQVLHLNS
jgi:excisionase family DNA binding protein